MANLITRGFGALQRIITRGFFSASQPSEDCYVGFIGSIEEDTSIAAFIGSVTDINGFSGATNAKDAAFSGTITGNNGFKGGFCDLCDC